jgi:hypothetical protein
MEVIMICNIVVVSKPEGKVLLVLGDVGLDGAITKWALNEYGGIVWNALTYLSIGAGGGPL